MSNLSKVTRADIVLLSGFEPGTFGLQSRCYDHYTNTPHKKLVITMQSYFAAIGHHHAVSLVAIGHHHAVRLAAIGHHMQSHLLLLIITTHNAVILCSSWSSPCSQICCYLLLIIQSYFVSLSLIAGHLETRTSWI